ncbi:MAG: DHH family phosphoesterase [Desulfobulbaceae bacterium]|jgi:single-stranded-DNA-specific exonuclease|nr:DHH family phosphoesterase [Desulfobulbaceae bacterium]
MPSPRITHRQPDPIIVDNLIDQSMAPWLARLLAGRIATPIDIDDVFKPSMANLPDPDAIPDLHRGVARIVQAIVNEEKIVLAVDHDMDGQGAAAVLWTAFVDHFQVDPELLQVVTSHRLTEGYGITMPVADRIIASGATLVISADKGSSDETQIKRIAGAGIDVVVTDHHEIPAEGPPGSAYACINPTIDPSRYDPFICGAGVAFLVMAKTRTALLAQGYFSECPSVLPLIDYVAVATVADCVALRPDRSFINRLFVKKGLEYINVRSRPCWQVFLDHIKSGVVDSSTIGFQLAPAVASAGRLDWADAGFLFLTAGSTSEAQKQWDILTKQNEERKTIEKSLRGKAFSLASAMHSQSLVLFIEDGHSGVHGITASRVVERFGKPTALFTEKEGADGRRVATGSFRGIPGFNVRKGLQYVDDTYPGILRSFGGHPGAAGASVWLEGFARFQVAYEEAVVRQLGSQKLVPEIFVDGELPAENLCLQTIDDLAGFDPWGKDFPKPMFTGCFQVIDIKPVGDGSHFKLKLGIANRTVDGIWFNGVDPGESMDVTRGMDISIVYQLADNVFRGRRSFQIQVVCLAD